METKFKLQLGAAHDLQDINAAVINGITFEYLADTMHSTIRTFHKETDLSTLVDEYTEIISNAYDGTFTSFHLWSVHKAESLAAVLAFVNKLDAYLSEKGKITAGQVISDIQQKLTDFLISLNSISITLDCIDIGDLDIKEEYVKTTIDQLEVVNEALLLATIIEMDLEITPIDIEKNKNSIIERKLANLDKIISTCDNIFENDIEKMNDQVLRSYEQFYNICYDTLTDGEKAEKARKVIKFINPHRQLLDKLEDKLTQANELSRQLILHKKKLDESLSAQKTDAESRIKEDPYAQDMIEFELDSSTYVINKYIEQIEEMSKRLVAINEKVSNHYNVLDKLEIALKTAIPSEDEMTKYSAIGFKLQELSVRLELSKSQVNKENKELKELIDTANMGINTMIICSLDVKDLFMRNSMMTATFKAVNALYNFVNGMDNSLAIAQIKFMTDKLSEYADYYNSFTKELTDYRRVGNNIIRDLSIIMGKPFAGPQLLEIIGAVDLGIKQLDGLYDSLKRNNDKQTELLNSILVL